MRHDVRLIRSPISVAGMVLTTISAVVFLIVFLADLFGLHTNPYLGILFFIVLPVGFLLGLGLIPLGAWIERRRRRRGKAPSELHWPRIDLNDPAQRRTAVVVFVLTTVNVVIVSLAAYRAVEYMDSVAFCGQVCHSVMKPEFVAHQNAPHSRVKCVQCHIGPGATGFARAKVSGTRQVLALALKTYSRPIPSPVENLRPARETCERCHWPEKFHGDKVVRKYEYADDEQNSETVTTLQVHVGGGSVPSGRAVGIHWHMNLANRVEYVATDAKRQVIPWIRVTDAAGNVREYVAEGASAEEFKDREPRLMDCVDCHNRPSHPMAPSAEKALDAAIAAGEIPRTLPFIRREGVKALKASYSTESAALDGIATALHDFYRFERLDVNPSRRQDIERAVAAAQRVFQRNVFPEMNVQFGTHPNNIGHMDSPGCFRCHDDSHKTADGKTISQDCETCHSIE
jgi:hypothetical protein